MNEAAGEDDLRRRAEQRLAKAAPAMPESEADLRRLVHELRVHQIELEMQNEALAATRHEAEDALKATERIADALHQSDQRFRLLVEQAVDAVLITASDGRLLFSNPAASRILGYTAEELESMTVLDIVPAQDRAITAHQLQIFRREGFFRAEVNVQLRDGRVMPFDLLAIVMPDGNGYAALRDIGDRRRAEAALQESEQRYRNLFEHLSQEVQYWQLVRDEAGRIVNWRLKDINPAGLRRWGKTREEALGKTMDELFPGEVEQFRPIVRQIFSEGKPYCWDFHPPEGDRHLQITCIPCGEHFINTAVDITEIKRTQEMLSRSLDEQFEIQDDLRQAKQESERANLSKSRFLAAASHDLRQPMATINLYLDMLGKAPPGVSQADLIVRLKHSSDTLNLMLNTLMDVARMDSGTMAATLTPVPAGEVFGWIEDEFSGQFSAKGLTLDYFHPHKELILHTDFPVLKSILINLLSNALKYCDKGRVFVSLRLRGDHALLQVWDNGIGITPEHLAHIFDEYFQVGNAARDVTKGLGLGLSIVTRQAALIEAKIECRSRVGRGSVFGLWLPLAGRLEEAAANKPSETRAFTDQEKFAGKRLMLIEDNVHFRDSLVWALEMSGFEMSPVASAEMALASPELEHMDFYISDYRLPGEMNGVQLLTEIQRRRRSPIRGVLLTGDALIQDGRSPDASPWKILIKPCSMEVLLGALAASEEPDASTR